MSCTVSESCKALIDSKDREIRQMDERIEDLELKIEEYENKETIMHIVLLIQVGLLAIAFQIWN